MRPSAFYSEPLRDLVRLALDSSPSDGLVVIATPKRQFSPSKNDDDIALRGTVVSSYANLRGVRCDHLPDLGLCNADLSENFIAIFAQPHGSLPFRPKLGDQCRSICTSRGENFLKRHKGVQGYLFETVLHFTTPTGSDSFHSLGRLRA
jgi:hypothetical protein